MEFLCEHREVAFKCYVLYFFNDYRLHVMSRSVCSFSLFEVSDSSLNLSFLIINVGGIIRAHMSLSDVIIILWTGCAC